MLACIGIVVVALLKVFRSTRSRVRSFRTDEQKLPKNHKPLLTKREARSDAKTMHETQY